MMVLQNNLESLGVRQFIVGDIQFGIIRQVFLQVLPQFYQFTTLSFSLFKSVKRYVEEPVRLS